VPASLVLQWVRELSDKFGIQAVAQKKEYTWEYDVVVASIDTAKRDPHRAIILGKDYDLIIIDEAHKLKNKKTTNYRFAELLRKKYCLLLTATPVQNNMDELFNLITLLKPGQLGDKQQFSVNYVVDKRQPKNEERLQEALSSVMIRNRRSSGNIHYTPRHVKNVELTLSPDEQRLYDAVTEFVHHQFSEGTGIDLAGMLSLVTLQREVCSSRDAVFLTLANLSKKTTEESPLRAKIWELVDCIREVKANTKAEKTMELIQGMQDKVIVFTEYRATQEYLLNYFQEHNLIAVPYRGGMNRGKKDWMMDLFRGRAQVLIATEAGGEGINLQFCNNMINFDLPWNPMRIEQRIGRIHRLGQNRDVNIYNLCTLGTIEEHIVRLLHEKIHLFELVIGDLETIIERFEQGQGSLSFEGVVTEAMLRARGDKERLRETIAGLGSSLGDIHAEVTARPGRSAATTKSKAKGQQ
jgi:SNF2 family DNA or RNA helicase